MTRPLPSESPNPEPIVLVVGYPAPAAAEMVGRLLTDDTRIIACVVSRDLWAEAILLHRDALDSGRLRLFEGDAATPGLGLPHTAWRILDTTDEIYAVASGHEIAAGHIQDFADECPRLREIHLVALGVAEADAVAMRSVPTALRRLRGSLRASRRGLAGAVALGAAGIARVAPGVLTVGPWKDVLDFDIETALSWEDLERDLWPGLKPVV